MIKRVLLEQFPYLFNVSACLSMAPLFCCLILMFQIGAKGFVLLAKLIEEISGVYRGTIDNITLKHRISLQGGDTNAVANTKRWRVARAIPLHRRDRPIDSSRTTNVCRVLASCVGRLALHSHQKNEQNRAGFQTAGSFLSHPHTLFQAQFHNYFSNFLEILV